MAKTTPSDLYRNTLHGAASDGALLMGKLIATARPLLQAREAACHNLRERDALVVSQKQLRAFESELSKRYPTLLLQAFTGKEAGRAQAARALTQVSFDELELMDETQVQSSVAMGRVQQLTLQTVEAVLAELNTLVCGAQGLGSVLAERNPLRPQVYIQALREVVEHTQVSHAVQVDWLGAMGVALGPELRKLYLRYCETLRGHGVMAAGYAVSTGHIGVGIGRGVAQDALHAPQGGTPRSGAPAASFAAAPAVLAPPPASDSRLLTLNRLHQLLTGELAHAPQSLSDKERFAQQFSQQFERGGAYHPAVDAPATDFDATVPAALEALKDMAQVQVVVQRLENRRNPAFVASVADDLESVRACLRSAATGVTQSLGLEVVSLMVENIAKDPRLLPSVHALVRSLEPALLLLSLVDARLFSSKAHPARQLLMDITERSLAYTSEDTPGVGGFLTAVEAAIAPLRTAPIEGPEPFEQALAELHQQWQRLEHLRAPQRKAAVDALVHAEQRNLLAEKIADEIARHPEAQDVPAVVLEFLCRPWALVLAQARLDRHADDGGACAKKYQAAIGALLWSTHPELPRHNVAKLTRLVPQLLPTLREGLDSIGYPTTQASAFLATLMRLHQRAFRTVSNVVQPQPLSPAPEAVPDAFPDDVAPFTHDDLWVAPQEALASNFIDLAPDLPTPLEEGADASALAQDAHAVLLPEDSDLQLGAWVELQIAGQWVRTQLTWASPHKTLFLFTTGGGSTQSMTRRSRDKLLAGGQLRIVSDRNVVDGALNAVAEEAMRNSVNTTY